MIRRAIIDKGTQEVLRYLRDKFIEGTDDQPEAWAMERADSQPEYFATDLREEEKQASREDEQRALIEEQAR